MLAIDYKVYSNSNQAVHYETEINMFKNKIKTLCDENLKLTQKLMENNEASNQITYLNEIVSEQANSQQDVKFIEINEIKRVRLRS